MAAALLIGPGSRELNRLRKNSNRRLYRTMPDISTIIEVIIITVKVGFMTMVLFALPLPLTWVERKVAGHIQARLGPWRVGPHGL
ncbi:MAG: NADH-quinone oxidoreductase subunit H, partial [Deltaproteobacteria bacterium]|nr:NADH-quinone oxidoreductase subunit H [Deltaproteobacteria bacterium]